MITRDIQIAVCDDDKNFLDRAAAVIRDVLALQNIGASVKAFSDPSQLLGVCAAAPFQFDIVFLDIEMPGMDGRTLAKELRALDAHFQLAFITSYEKYVYDVFEYDTTSFIRKERFDDQIEAELVRLIQNIEKGQADYLQFEASDANGHYCTVKVNLNDILYVDCIQKRVFLHTLQGVVPLRKMRFEALRVKLLSLGFVQVHRLSVVNLRYVNSVTHDNILLDNGDKVCISRRLYHSILQDFSNYAKVRIIENETIF